MKYNPAETLEQSWEFLKMGHQKANIPVLKEYVFDLIRMMTQKTAGQSCYRKGKNGDYLDYTTDYWPTINAIVIEAMALVLSGKLDDLEEKTEKEYDDEENMG
jgi:hypothetical protein|nr:MAG TPA_asm: hypothetical protein [Caudoviricetes sp.]